jgi:hypothetical protein
MNYPRCESNAQHPASEVEGLTIILMLADDYSTNGESNN